MTLSPKMYDAGKWVVQTFIPALITFYSGLSVFVDVPEPLTVAGVLGAVALFLGSILGISNAQFKKMNDADAGALRLVGTDPETGMPHLSLQLNKTPNELLAKDTITLQVPDQPIEYPFDNNES